MTEQLKNLYAALVGVYTKGNNEEKELALPVAIMWLDMEMGSFVGGELVSVDGARTEVYNYLIWLINHHIATDKDAFYWMEQRKWFEPLKQTMKDLGIYHPRGPTTEHIA